MSPAERDLGFVAEIYDVPPDFKPAKPDAIYPPEAVPPGSTDRRIQAQ